MKRDYIYILIIVLLLIIGTCSITRCNRIGYEYENNLIALNDTIHSYKTKNKQLAVTTLAYQTDLKNLELLNNDLYEEIKNLKIKHPTTGTHFSGTIVNEVHDTTFIMIPDTASGIACSPPVEFNFNNRYRILEGTISRSQDEFNLKINKDIVNFDYTLALDEKNNIYITSSNPYVKYNDITGFTLPKQRTKRWALGPSVNYGYDPVNNKSTFSIGCSLTYGLIRF